MLQNLGIQMTANARNKHTQIEDGLPTEDRLQKSAQHITVPTQHPTAAMG